MSKVVTVTFQGELGIELNVDRASGAVRIKRAEADSPAKPHEGAALRSINGKPVGRIVDKAAWLALVERLKAPARPLVLALAGICCKRWHKTPYTPAVQRLLDQQRLPKA